MLGSKPEPVLPPRDAYDTLDLRVGLEGFLEHGWHALLAVSEEEWKELLPAAGFEPPAFVYID